jgi:hypothetical protein
VSDPVVPAQSISPRVKILLAVVGFGSLIAVIFDCIVFGMLKAPASLMVPSFFGHALSAALSYVAVMPRDVNVPYRNIARIFTVIAPVIFVAASIGVIWALAIAFK